MAAEEGWGRSLGLPAGRPALVARAQAQPSEARGRLAASTVLLGACKCSEFVTWRCADGGGVHLEQTAEFCYSRCVH